MPGLQKRNAKPGKGESTRSMIKSYEKITKQEKPILKIPRKVQDIIPIDCIYKDGIFRCGQKFTKSFKFSDINFMVASEDDKEDMLEKYAAFINGLDGAATTKLTINNHKFNRRDFERNLLMRPPAAAAFCRKSTLRYLLPRKTLKRPGGISAGSRPNSLQG